MGIIRLENVLLINSFNALKNTNPERGSNIFPFDRIPTIFPGHKVLPKFSGHRLDPLQTDSSPFVDPPR